MKKTLQVLKAQSLNYNSIRSGLNYRMTIRDNGQKMGHISINLNKYHNTQSNTILKNLLQNQEYTILRDQTKMIFEGSFDALKVLTGVTTYYPDTGLLVYDVSANKLVLHLTKENVQCQGIVLGYVMDQDAITILDSLRASTIPLQARLENTYNYYLKRTLNVSLAVSLLVFYNAFTGSQKSKFGVFERDDKSPQFDSK
ncbi:unnamed protein product [Paramecium primaurelia]|uniref:Uncharacterized protein n=1 Tax=Paramecium primaurelia TaxID=5886 RepID=A0A8S1QDK1_PARPR|nr:unnamed protein product [Paramecium primaurelia]CAD8113525.1 unnamed protein product [Paramecium primaurelia]CAD8113527.1 unnamed protein product [Paramecium primaurelia]